MGQGRENTEQKREKRTRVSESASQHSVADAVRGPQFHSFTEYPPSPFWGQVLSLQSFVPLIICSSPLITKGLVDMIPNSKDLRGAFRAISRFRCCFSRESGFATNFSAGEDGLDERIWFRLCAKRGKLSAKQREVFEAFFHGVAGIFCSGDLNDSPGDTRDGSTDSRPCSFEAT